jgi:citrate lyase synthetase
MWLTLSAAAFPASEAKNQSIVTRYRNELAAKMFFCQIAEARRLAHAWTRQ